MTSQNLRVPFDMPIPGGLTPGKIVILEGTVPSMSLRFAVNFISKSGDLALHLSPKFKENRVTLNTVQHMMFGQEESCDLMHIYPGQDFQIKIQCEAFVFKIFFNNRSLTEFKHRLPFSSVEKLEVEGEVVIHNVEFREAKNQENSSSLSSASYGFQSGPTSPTYNSGGTRTSGSLYPSSDLPSSNDLYPPNGPYPTAPNTHPDSYPSAPKSSGGPYPPTGSYPAGGFRPPQPNGPPPSRYPYSHNDTHSSGGSYPPKSPHSSGGSNPPHLYPSFPNPGPHSDSGRSPYHPNIPSYPTQPGYPNIPHQGPYPQGPYSQGPYPQGPYPQGPYPQGPNSPSNNYNPSPSSKPGFLDQAGMALAGILGPGLLAGGMNKRSNPQGYGRGSLLDQAGRALAGVFGGPGYSGTDQSSRGTHPRSPPNQSRSGILDQAGSALAGILGGSGLMGNNIRRFMNNRP